MFSVRLLPLALAVAGLVATAQSPATPEAIQSALGKLRSLSEAERGPRTGELARQIAALPAGKQKDGLAVSLAHLATEGDPGHDNLQAVTTTLAEALLETPVPVKGDPGLTPYNELAELVRYEGMTVPAGMAENADYKNAAAALVRLDDEIGKTDFTLKDLNGKKVTLSSLRGKIVVVNFWATWCPPCRVELPSLDAIADRFASQVVVLALTDEDGYKVNSLLSGHNLHFTVLLDDGHKVGKQFHVNGIPKTFVFNAEGKLVTESIDMRTQRQFLHMLAQAGLKPSAGQTKPQTGQ